MSFIWGNKEDENDCPNCFELNSIMSNSSGDHWCDNCGWQAEDEEIVE